jgi:hypothetical protein
MTTENCLRCCSRAIDFVRDHVVHDSDTPGLSSRAGGRPALRQRGRRCLLHSEPL